MAAHLQAVADQVVLPPTARWSCPMRAGGWEWPVGLFRPLADAATPLRYALGKSVCAVAGPHPELVGRAVLGAVLDLAELGACPGVVLQVEAPPSLRRSAPDVVLASPAMSRALFPCFTIQPLGDGPLLAFPAGAAPPGLLAALDAFFPMVEAPSEDLPDDGAGDDLRAKTSAWNWWSTRMTSTSLVCHTLPPSSPPFPASLRSYLGGGGGGGGSRRLSPWLEAPPPRAGIPGAARGPGAPQPSVPREPRAPARLDFVPPGQGELLLCTPTLAGSMTTTPRVTATPSREPTPRAGVPSSQKAAGATLRHRQASAGRALAPWDQRGALREWAPTRAGLASPTLTSTTNTVGLV